MHNPIDLSGKNIIVTGASSGIGRATAVLIGKLGANVILAGRNEECLNETLSEMNIENRADYEAAPQKHCFYLIDLKNTEEIGKMFEHICSDGRKLHGLVHSAGISVTVPLQYLKMSDLNEIMSVNFYSFVELVKNFCKRKYYDGCGSIIAISSISSRVGARGLSAYCASKGALESAVRAMAIELAPKNIRINTISPGMIGTQMYGGLKDIVNNKEFENELRKRQFMGIGEPEDVAYAAAFLLSDASKFITGTSMIVDGGYSAH